MKTLILNLFHKYRWLIAYGVVGCGTTAINWLCYYVLSVYTDASTLLATGLAWLFSTVFSFFANKLLVFKSTHGSWKRFWMEITTFFGARALTLVLDEAIMHYAVDVRDWNGLLWKVISNVVVILLNLVAMRFISFGKPKE